MPSPRCWPEVNSTTRPSGRVSSWRAANACTRRSDAHALTAHAASSSAAVISPRLCFELPRVVGDDHVERCRSARSRRRPVPPGLRDRRDRTRRGPAGRGPPRARRARPAVPAGSAPHGCASSCAAWPWTRTDRPSARSRRATAKPMPARRLTPVTSATRGGGRRLHGTGA